MKGAKFEWLCVNALWDITLGPEGRRDAMTATVDLVALAVKRPTLAPLALGACRELRRLVTEASK